MTDKEKALEIADNQPLASNNENYREMIVFGAEKMAQWKDKQYKKEFNVPDYITSFEDITNYISNDVYYKGYNKAKEYHRNRLKEYLETRMAELDRINDDILYTKTIDFIKEMMKHFEL